VFGTTALRLVFSFILLSVLASGYLKEAQPDQVPAPNQQSTVKQSSLLEIGRPVRQAHASQSPSELKIISYNIRWRSGEELRSLIELFRHDEEIGGAGILGLQEVDRNKKRTQQTNTVRLIADELGFNYAWTAPPAAKPNDEEGTGVAILSPYPLSNVQQIVLPHEGPGNRRRVALGATITIKNLDIRAYTVHSETRISVGRKLEQMQAVLKDLSRYPPTIPAIVLGDLNTWEPSAVKKTRKLFTQENFQTPLDDQPTFYRRILLFPLKLKLDWIWLRNLEAVSSGIDRKISLSDHWPLWCIVKMKDNQPAS